MERFYRAVKNKDGLDNRCIACVARRARERCLRTRKGVGAVPDEGHAVPGQRGEATLLRPDDATLKRCCDCGDHKPVTEFDLDRRSGWRQSYCIACRRARARERYYVKKEGKSPSNPTRPLDPEGWRVCPNCGERKPPSEYARSPRRCDGLHTYCRPCNSQRGYASARRLYGSTRSMALRRRYGITDEQASALSAAQGGVCAICRSRPPEHVDHDHATNAVRGMRCFGCNNGLGMFADDPELLQAASAYLREEDARCAGLADGFEVCVCCKRAVPQADLWRTERHRLKQTSRQPFCRECYVAAHAGTDVDPGDLGWRETTMRKYGLKKCQADEVAVRQGGVCAVCRTGPTENVDHDHRTGRVRGMLCSGCNSGMGNFGDDPERLLAAASYLRRAGVKTAA